MIIPRLLEAAIRDKLLSESGRKTLELSGDDPRVAEIFFAPLRLCVKNS